MEINEARNKLRFLEKENKTFKRENNGLLNDKDRMTREKVDALHEKNITKAGVNALTREIEYLRKQTELERSNIGSLLRDRDMMKKNIDKAEDDNMNNRNEIFRMKNELTQEKEKNKELKTYLSNLDKQI